MTVFKRRTRMVNFRLSEDEYRDLRNVCIANGSRSVSDFARDAVCQMIAGNGSSSHAELSVHDLHARFEDLDREVKRLGRLFEQSAPAVLPPSAAAPQTR